jgi:transcriptional regulator with XRE-family HTH domain
MGKLQNTRIISRGNAERLGIYRTRHHISQYERGKAVPFMEVLLAYARLANATMNQIADADLDLPRYCVCGHTGMLESRSQTLLEGELLSLLRKGRILCTKDDSDSRKGASPSLTNSDAPQPHDLPDVMGRTP